MIGAKGHQSVKASKMKGHETEEQVEAGKVSREDKEGNGEADSAADKGAGEQLKVLSDMAGLFSFRNGKYMQMVARIHRFVVAMKNRKSCQRRARQSNDAFGGKYDQKKI